MDGDLPSTPVREGKSHLHKVMATNPAGGSSPAVHIPPTPFLKRIGYGTGVDVFLYERSAAENGNQFSPWALKRVTRKRACQSYDIVHRLEQEAAILKRLSHPNIIGYRGFKTLENGSRVLAMEDGHRSLMDLIDKRNDAGLQRFPAEKIEKVIHSVAKALAHLHHDIKLLHGDIKSANILVKNDFEAIKLCDFGVSVPLDQNGFAQNEHTYVGTDLWCAPEVIDGETFSHKADIFSLGLVVYEMISLQLPHVQRLAEEESSFTDSEESVLEEDEDELPLGTRPDLPADFDHDNSYKQVLELYFTMTQKDPTKRPDAREIVDYFEK